MVQNAVLFIGVGFSQCLYSLVIALDMKMYEFLCFIIRRQVRSNEYRSIVIVV